MLMAVSQLILWESGNPAGALSCSQGEGPRAAAPARANRSLGPAAGPGTAHAEEAAPAGEPRRGARVPLQASPASLPQSISWEWPWRRSERREDIAVVWRLSGQTGRERSGGHSQRGTAMRAEDTQSGLDRGAVSVKGPESAQGHWLWRQPGTSATVMRPGDDGNTGASGGAEKSRG